MKKKYKIIIISFFILTILTISAKIGYKALLKFRDMYRNVLDTITETAEEQTQKIKIRARDAYSFDYSWVKNNVLIAHALGGIDGIDYTNSREAFLYNYNLGYRVFEVDFSLTDGEYLVVCDHDREDWVEGITYNYENFMSSSINGEYSTLSGKDIIDLMIEYPDIYIITDSKSTEPYDIALEFSQIIKYANEKDPSVLDRIIPQVYNEDMFWQIMNLYEWKSVIYTLYLSNWTEESVLEFCDNTGVRFITVHESRAQEVIDIFKDNNLIVATHTINDEEKADYFLSLGIDMLYSDFLLPEIYSKE